ncbi:MAG TPA: tRNA lysidine(34) synthetase TilS [Candidatus Hydrogenedentes bacterium]|nr:tRNA lysidine(34) synthetase TilS [Candidatus Hydrogenedentota bacterium]
MRVDGVQPLNGFIRTTPENSIRFLREGVAGEPLLPKRRLWSELLSKTTEMLIERVRRTIAAHNMIGAGERVLAAVSGGADSVCLLDALGALGYALEVAHFDHQTRNGESGEDAAFVRELAARRGLPFHTASRAIEPEAAASPLSFEEYARQARYEFLLDTAEQVGCACVATGHQADDQAETVLMRLLRGTAPHGLAGIPPVRAERGVRIVRPLLACTRNEVLAYLEDLGLPHQIDRTNADTRFLRNKVRHELLPRLAEFNPRVRDALCRLADLERVENAFIEAAARTFWQQCLGEDQAIDRQAFARGDPALQRRAVLMLAWGRGVDCPFDRVAAAARFIAEGSTGRAFDLGGGVTLHNGRTTTEVRTGPVVLADRVIPLAVPGDTEAFGRLYRVRRLDRVPAADLAAYCSPTRQVFDAQAAGAALAVRHRRAGDRFTPLGMTGTKKLKDYFIDIGLPATRRDSQPLLVSGETVLWVIGYAIAAHGAVGPETSQVIEIEVVDANW